MDNLITLYQQHLNLQDSTFLRIEHEDAMVAIVYKITLSTTGAQFILKISSRAQDYMREVYFLKHLESKLPVPRIIQVVKPEAEINGAILMEYLPGALLKISDLTDKLAYEIGSQLARIHLNRISGYGDLTQPDDLNPDPRVYFTSKFDEGFDECSNHLPKSLLEKCRHYFDSNIDRLASVDGPCMIHRDFRPGNIIVNNGKLHGIIDWASGRASFAEEDFCPLEFGEWPTDPTNKQFFLNGYASIRSVPDYSAIMPLLRLNRAIATIGFTVKQRTWETSNSKLYQFNRQFLETFF
jgi:Ser/Thr protein kinase RdoA (MazF antagonist)